MRTCYLVIPLLISFILATAIADRDGDKKRNGIQDCIDDWKRKNPNAANRHSQEELKQLCEQNAEWKKGVDSLHGGPAKKPNLTPNQMAYLAKFRCKGKDCNRKGGNKH